MITDLIGTYVSYITSSIYSSKGKYIFLFFSRFFLSAETHTMSHLLYVIFFSLCFFVPYLHVSVVSTNLSILLFSSPFFCAFRFIFSVAFFLFFYHSVFPPSTFGCLSIMPRCSFLVAPYPPFFWNLIFCVNNFVFFPRFGCQVGLSGLSRDGSFS